MVNIPRNCLKLIVRFWNIIGQLPEVENFEGDMILSRAQQAMTTSLHYDSDVASKGVWDKADFEWPDRIIPYFIHPRLSMEYTH